MGEVIKNTDQNPKLGDSSSTQESITLTLRIKEEEQKRQQAALLMAQLEEFTQSLLEEQTTEGKAQINENASSNQVKENNSPKAQGMGGMNFFISNNIPFSMFVDMIQERLKQLNTQSEAQQQISLAYVGKNKTTNEDGSVSYSDQEGGGIIDMICSTIIAGASADSMKTFLSGTQSLAESGSVLGSMLGLRAGNTDEENAEVNRLKNARDVLNNSPPAEDAIVGEEGANGQNQPTPREAAVQDAIESLISGQGADKLQLGSVKNSKGGFDKVDMDDERYIAQAGDRGHLVGADQQDETLKVTAEEAIAAMNKTQKKAIIANLNKELEKAEEKVAAKQKKIDTAKNMWNQITDSAAKAAKGGVVVQSSTSDVAKGQANADQQAYQALQTAISKMADTQDKGVDNRRNAIDQANQDLQKIISTVGQRG